MEREFDLGDVLSITTGRLVSLRHMRGVYDILGFMSGEDVFTHQIPRIAREAESVILDRHPQLKDIVVSELNESTFAAWLANQKVIFGDTLLIPTMDAEQHERIDPMSELAERLPPDRIVALKV